MHDQRYLNRNQLHIIDALIIVYSKLILVPIQVFWVVRNSNFSIWSFFRAHCAGFTLPDAGLKSHYEFLHGGIESVYQQLQ